MLTKRQHEGKSDKVAAIQSDHASRPIILDSGCTNHVFHHTYKFFNLVPHETSMMTADGSAGVVITHKGDVALPTKQGRPFMLKNACKACSTLPRNYVSETQLEIEHGWSMYSTDGRRWFTDKRGNITVEAKRSNGMCMIPDFKGVNSITDKDKDSLILWHHRMAHTSPATILKTAKAVDGMAPEKGEIFKISDCGPHACGPTPSLGPTTRSRWSTVPDFLYRMCNLTSRAHWCEVCAEADTSRS